MIYRCYLRQEKDIQSDLRQAMRRYLIDLNHLPNSLVVHQRNVPAVAQALKELSLPGITVTPRGGILINEIWLEV